MAYLLLVDDDEDFATATATVLRSAGHEVQVCLDTASAVTEIKNRRPDLILLDVMFPENPSAGFELAREINQGPEGLGQIPVLMLTAINVKFPLGFSSNDIDDNFLPVADFLEKPVDFDVLLKKVGTLLGGGDVPAPGGEG